MKRDATDKKHFFTFPFGARIPTRVLWDSLRTTFEHILPQYLEKLEIIRQDSSIAHTYGPSLRDILDKHGAVIRTELTPAEICDNYEKCQCSHVFPKYVDKAVGHVRTTDAGILPHFCQFLGYGLNYRPKYSMTAPEVRMATNEFAVKVLKKFRSSVIRAKQASIIDHFMNRIMRGFKPQTKWPTEKQWRRKAQTYLKHLVIFSTDKVANTPSIECIHHYRHICLNRLLSPAFSKIPNEGRRIFEQNLQHAVDEWTPWASSHEFTPAILFATAKMHKRSTDPLAYRYITSDCNGYSKPISDECVRVLTALTKTVREHCIDLQNEHNAKFWWAIDSVDIPPLNINMQPKHTRQISAFDLDKCFESIPILHGEHSLIKHVEFFVRLAFRHGNGDLLASEVRYDGTPLKECTWSDSRTRHRSIYYTSDDVIELVKTLTQMTYITVGTTAAKQLMGIPMGFSASVILLNIYAFMPEYLFTWRLIRLQPALAKCTLEFYRYVDDLGNFSELDLRPYLNTEELATDMNPYWIYPLAPRGPLSMSDQTERHSNFTKVVYLNMQFTLTGGILVHEWYQKHKTYDFHTCKLTHWTSHVSNRVKHATVNTMARMAILTASNTKSLLANLKTLICSFRQLGYPKQVFRERLEIAMSMLFRRLPPQHLCKLLPENGVLSFV